MTDVERVVAVSKTDDGMGEGVVPHVAIQTHLNGDSHVRPGEITSLNETRKKHGLDDFICVILTPDETMADEPFPGYASHPWRIYEQDGQPLVEPTDLKLEWADDDQATLTTAYTLEGDKPTTWTRGMVNHVQPLGKAEDRPWRIVSEAELDRGEDLSPDSVRVSIGHIEGEEDWYFVYHGDPEAVLDATRVGLTVAELKLRPPSTQQMVDGKGRPYNYDKEGNPVTADTLLQEIAENDRDQFMFRITREAPDGRTFSAPALEGLARQVLTFVLARLDAHWKEHQAPPRDLMLYLDLMLHSEPWAKD
jgi:hypothetical protein